MAHISEQAIRDEFEERAAILEFGSPRHAVARKQADRLAFEATALWVHQQHPDRTIYQVRARVKEITRFTY